MTHTTLREHKELVEFVEKASQKFAQDSELATFGDLLPDTYLGIRWGLMEDCVLVVKLDPNFTPYIQAIKRSD